MTMIEVAPSHDLAVVARVLQGDESAGAALVERLHPLVMAIVRRRLPRRSDEADRIQSVFLRVFTRLEQYSGKAPLEHWVSRIAISACLNELRYERNRPELRRADLTSELEEVLDVLDRSDEALAPHQQLAANDLVRQLLQRLSLRERLVITMRYLEGHTLAEIHQSTGWSALAVRLLAFRARRRMKKTLQFLLKEGPR